MVESLRRSTQNIRKEPMKDIKGNEVLQQENNASDDERVVKKLEEEYEKKGYKHLRLIKDDCDMILYIKDEMPINAAFDGSLDIVFKLREIYRSHVELAVKKANEEREKMSNKEKVQEQADNSNK